MQLSNNLKRVFLVCLVVLMVMATGCIGGGDNNDSGSGVKPLTYDGNTSAAKINLTNAPTLLVNVLYGGDAATDIPAGKPAESAQATSSGSVASIDAVVTIMNYTKGNIFGIPSVSFYIPSALKISDTVGCDTGYYTMEGTLDDYTGAGDVQVSYIDCSVDGVVYNGDATITFYSIDVYTGSSYGSMSFDLLTMEGDLSGSMSGTMYIDDIFSGTQYTKNIRMDMVIQDNIVGKMYKYDDYAIMLTVYDMYDYDTSASIGYSGTVYDSVHGSLTISGSSFVFSSLYATEPDSGGPVIMTGDASQMQITPLSIRHVMLEMDLDGNGTFEVVRYILWTEIDDYLSMDLADNDGDSMHNSWESMNGLDPDVNDAGDDTDLDTYTNLEEYQAGSDPQDMASIPIAP